MKICNSIFIAGLLLYSFPLFSQPLFTTTQVNNAYRHETRATSGRPGKNYWQNKADYNIQVTFEPYSSLLAGHEVITYQNNSPDTLKQIIIRLYPDLYKKGVSRLSIINEKDVRDGVTIDSFRIGNEIISNFSDSPNAYKNTNLVIKPRESILPHSTIQLYIGWHYLVNTGSPVRTGMVDSGSYFIAYFFPRLAVYDDIDGWDTWSYNGLQEFYNDFGNFNVDISVPKNYVIWATGNRINAAENFSEHIIRKLETASTSDSIIHVIDSTDYKKNNNVFSPRATGNLEVCCSQFN